MATLTTTNRMSAGSFFEWTHRPENEGRSFELDRGEPVEMPVPGQLHGLVCWLVIRALTNYLTARGRGHLLTNDSGIVVETSPDTVRGPDVSLYLHDLTIDLAETGYTSVVPELVVEVRSPTDRDSRILKRVGQFHRIGVPLVWVIDPEDRVVTVYRPNEFPKVFDESDDLSGNGILPDFTCKVSALFTLPGQPPAAVTP